MLPIGIARALTIALASVALLSCPAGGEGPRPVTEIVIASEPEPRPEPAVEPEPVVEPAPGAEPEPVAGPEPEPERVGEPEASVDPERALVSIAKETIIRSAPRWEADKIGYLRAGAVVARAPEPSSFDHCSEGWHEIEPAGFVCVGKTASIDVDHPIARAAGRRANRGAPLPYHYGRSRFPTPPFYVRVPTGAQQRAVEPELQKHLRSIRPDPWENAPLGPLPEFLSDYRPVRTLRGYVHSSRSVYTGRARPESGFAFVELFEANGRKFGLTVDMDVVPLDRTKRVVASDFRGIELGEGADLPVAFAMTRYAQIYDGDPRTSGVLPRRALLLREAVPLGGEGVRAAGVLWWATKDGGWVRNEGLVRVNPMVNRPGWATAGRTWIDVSILKQTLVAYVGTRPVYATLVSTGADGLGDPEKTHSTVQGRFLIHTKHVTATMSSDEAGDEFDLRDVPYVQYFSEGYALHAAYWHSSFGKPRSHGCINLSPTDAAWLFEWTDPEVPSAWHGAMSLREGTLVSIHP